MKPYNSIITNCGIVIYNTSKKFVVLASCFQQDFRHIYFIMLFRVLLFLVWYGMYAILLFLYHLHTQVPNVFLYRILFREFSN